MSLQIAFTLRERDLLLNLMTIEPDIAAKLRVAKFSKGSISITLNGDDLDVLLGAIAADANHTKNKKLEKELDGLYARVDEFLQNHLDNQY
jgi:hypothetical protein